VLSIVAAIIKVPEAFFTRYPVEACTALSSISDISDLLRRLLDGGHSVIAGRLAGAFRHMGRERFADEIISAMKTALYDVRETNPFVSANVRISTITSVSPITIRMKALWDSMREVIITEFPQPPGLADDRDSYLRHLESSYVQDAYHSLSIEGYNVTGELIERVSSGDWNPEQNELDRQNRDALAARGYWQAFQLVKDAVDKILEGENPSSIVRIAHMDWYRELFQPCAVAGLIPITDLAGYRNAPVFLKSSRHVPPRSEVVSDAMSTIFDLLECETESAVRAVLGHWLIGYIHPYMDGNGRIARFVMNVMLASGGYPWTIIHSDDRTRYMSCLEKASVESDIQPFVSFIAEQLSGKTDDNPSM